MQGADVKAGAGLLPVPTEVDEVDLVPVRTYWQLVRQRFVRHRLAVIGTVTLVIIIVDRRDHPVPDRGPVPEVEPRS